MEDFMDSYLLATKAINTAKNTASVLGTYLGEVCDSEDCEWVLMGVSEDLEDARKRIDAMCHLFTDKKGGEQE